MEQASSILFMFNPAYPATQPQIAIASDFAVSKNVIIVGGGLAGLSAAVYLARAGRTVTIFERRRYLGGRAVTHLRHGYRFNLGPHAFFRAGLGWNVLRELGIPVRGGVPKVRGFGMLGTQRFKFPGSLWSILTTSLFGLKAKMQMLKLFLRIRRIDPKPYASMTVREWIDANASDERVRLLLEAVFRLATYSNRPDLQGAGAFRRHHVVECACLVGSLWPRILELTACKMHIEQGGAATEAEIIATCLT